MAAPSEERPGVGLFECAPRVAAQEPLEFQSWVLQGAFAFQLAFRIQRQFRLLQTRLIGRNFGPEFLLKLYLAGALGGSLFYLVHHAFMHLQAKGQGMFSIDPSRMPGLGASGAVNAIMLLDIFLFPKATLYFDFIIPIPAILLGIFLISKDLLRIIKGDSEISGSAHLGGAAVAAITWAQLRKGRF